MKNRLMVGVSISFWVAMLFLTIFAQNIHNASLPQVEVQHPTRQEFSQTCLDENDTFIELRQEKLAIPIQTEKIGLFRVYRKEKNGTERFFVEQVYATLGEEQNGYIAIEAGIYEQDIMVVESSKILKDGDEVWVRK